jgi:metal-sulfur cluster biosynthetic enzyme
VKVQGDDVLVRLCEPGELARRAETGVAPATSSEASVTAAGIAADALMPDSSEAGAAQASASPPAVEGTISEDRVREELKKVIDPELFVNIVDLGLIYNVDLAETPEGKVHCKIDMTMTSPMCPAGPQMIANSKQVLGQLPNMGDVEVKIVLDPPWTPDRMTDEARDQLGIF